MTPPKVQSLTKRIQELKAELAEVEAERLTLLHDQIKTMVDQSGLTMQDVKASFSEGRKVAAKYRNPDDPTQTWTGRGRMPIWLVQYKRAGGRLDDTIIKKGDRTGRKLGRVAAKYQNPENPTETWSGRGRKPRWMMAQLGKGQSIESMMIK